MKRIAAALLTGAMAIGLLCGFAADTGEETLVEYVRRQWQTAEQVSEIVVTETEANVIVKAAQDAQTENITVEYADTEEEELYTFSIEEESLAIQKLKGRPQALKSALHLGRLKLFSRNVPLPDNGVDTTLIITLPQKEYASILVTNSAGDVTFEDIEAQNLTANVSYGKVLFDACSGVDMTAQSTYGSVTFEDAAAQSLSVNSTYGDVAFEDAAAQNLSVDSTYGSVEFNGVTSDSIAVNKCYGDIIFASTLASVYRCSTTYGDIKGTLLGKEADYAATYERKMTYGDVAEVKTVEQTEPQHMVSGAGSRKIIDFSTNYGNIKIKFAE